MKWSSKDEAILIDNYQGSIMEMLPLIPNRKYKAISAKIERMGLNKAKYHKWNNSEVMAVVEKRLEGKKYKQIAAEMGLSVNSVKLIMFRKL